MEDIKIQRFSVPIRLEVGLRKKKMYYLNLNGYRNWQFQLNNQLNLRRTYKFLRQHLGPVGKHQITGNNTTWEQFKSPDLSPNNTSQGCDCKTNN